MNTVSRNAQVISEQVSRLESTLLGLLEPDQPYALVDFPDHSNVGDSAIWMGEMALLSRLLNRAPSYVGKYNDFSRDELEACMPQGPILIHGGGNFGDIWPNHHPFRERLLREFPERRIIQLPQTLGFKHAANVQTCGELIRHHGDFHLLVRDHRSLAFAQKEFQCPVTLAPDMAFGLGALNRPTVPQHEVFMLLREDVERSSAYSRDALLVMPSSSADDWLAEPPDFRDLTRRLYKKLGLTYLLDHTNIERVMNYNRKANMRVLRGLKMLSSGQGVITDRLHAHILSVLLDIPHVVLDNNYGKIFSYIDAWTHTYPAMNKAVSAEDAMVKIRGLQALDTRPEMSGGR